MSALNVPSYDEYDLHDVSNLPSLPPDYDSDETYSGDHLVDTKGESIDEDASTASNGSIILDCVKTEDVKHGTCIVSRSTLGGEGGIMQGDVLYTYLYPRKWSFKGSLMTFYRGDASGAIHGSATGSSTADIEGSHPYAELSYFKMKIEESPDTRGKLGDTSRWKFMHADKWWKLKNRFSMDGTEYRFHRKANGNYELYMLSAGCSETDGLLLATFSHKHFSSTNKRGSIVIHRAAVSNGSSGDHPPRTALIYNGRPTWLLDIAIVAESVCKQEFERQMAAAAGSAGW